MSYDPNGYLAFGFYIGAEEDENDENEWLFDDESFETKVFEAFKQDGDLGRPTDAYPNLGLHSSSRETLANEQAVLDAYAMWWKTQSLVFDDAGVELMRHGHDGGSLSLIVKDSLLSVEWGETADVTAHLNRPHSRNYETVIADFCERVGIKHQPPKWLLACSYA